MLDKVNIGEGQPVGQIQPSHQPVAPSKRAAQSFEAVIKKEIEKLKGLRFSAHALQRLTARNIRLSTDDVKKVVEAMDRAQAKGAKDSLVLVRDAAFVVSIKNRTVVTVLDREEMRGNVFTHIDSAVLMDGDEREA